MSTALPETIQAIVIGDHSASVQSINFASEKHIQNLDANSIIVRVRAIGINPTDWKHALGEWGKPGNVSGCDSAGDIVRIGSEVKHLQVGDRIAAFNTRGGTQPNNGAFAEYTTFDSALAFKIPEGMTYEEAASFPIPHYTAFQALHLRLNLPFPSSSPTPSSSNDKAQTILIWGGSTAVGHHAVQLAHLAGVRVFVTASPDTHAHLKELGADETFDYKDADVVSKIQKAAGERGVTLALDTVVEKGSTEKIIDSIYSRGGKVITLLPISDEIAKRRAEVELEFTLAYTLGGHELKFAQQIPFPANPSDHAGIREYLDKELPLLLEGWKERAGSAKFKTQELRKVEAGSWHEAVIKSFKIMQSGDYGRQKLVISVP
ncbi:chaperonin 10-like protein [Pterulicium gracile]|uniref:Chaperonin 10-like protein n=1 Tax=Pterulicium gracile TaxID=1884261 RepID=A0A5C3QKF2_9AGAR|nr:chaperonin 10-like protein [Pterula gracilis]